MKCPFCQCEDTKVTDSRLADNGESVRRRRQCDSCDARFTSYERVELELPRLMKSDGAREEFNEEKLRAGLYRALEKRPVDAASIEAAVASIRKRLMEIGEREVSTKVVGEAVMNELRILDEVAYVRFASVYRSFQDLDAFREEIDQFRAKVLEKGSKQ